MFELTPIRSLYYVIVLWACSNSLFARGFKLDVMGGISSPTPGYAVGGQACRVLFASHCLGFSYLANQNEQASERFSQFTQHFDGFLEKDVFLKDEYHLLFVQVAAGAAHVVRKADSDALDVAGDTFKKWVPSYGAGMGFEMPVADLMGIRLGVLARQSVVANAKIQIASVLGFRIGSEWFGIGD